MEEKRLNIKKLTLAAVLMAMNVIMSSSILSLPVPGGHMYLNDVIICTAAVLLEPFYAFLVGGLGAFLGDFLFYQPPMFVSLVTHGVQAVVISLFVHRLFREKRMAGSILGALLGLVITVTGYTLGRAYLYSTPAYAAAKFPFQILQTLVGEALALLLCWKAGVVKLYEKQFKAG